MDSLYCCIQLVFYGKNSNFLCKKIFLNGLTITKLNGNIIPEERSWLVITKKRREPWKIFL